MALSVDQRHSLGNRYGYVLCESIGYDKLDSIPVVPAAQLQLEKDEAYPRPINPELFEGNMVRGMTHGRCFVALKLNILDPVTEQVTGTVAELFHSTTPYFPDAKYATTRTVLDEKGTEHRSLISEDMVLEMSDLKSLLEGQTLKKHDYTPLPQAVLIRLAPYKV